MNKLLDLLRLMRPHQWVKNTFVFTGLLFGHAWHDAHLVAQVITAFAAFCLVSSAVYVFNDIIDVEQDRLHPKKSSRPLASGRVGIPAAAVLAVRAGSVRFGAGKLRFHGRSWSFWFAMHS